MAILGGCAALNSRVGATARTLGELPGDMVIAISKGEHDVVGYRIPDPCVQIVADALDLALSPDDVTAADAAEVGLTVLVQEELCRQAIRASIEDGTFFVDDMKITTEGAA